MLLQRLKEPDYQIAHLRIAGIILYAVNGVIGQIKKFNGLGGSVTLNPIAFKVKMKEY
jgi:hypothetical protein